MKSNVDVIDELQSPAAEFYYKEFDANDDDIIKALAYAQLIEYDQDFTFTEFDELTDTTKIILTDIFEHGQSEIELIEDFNLAKIILDNMFSANDYYEDFNYLYDYLDYEKFVSDFVEYDYRDNLKVIEIDDEYYIYRP